MKESSVFSMSRFSNLVKREWTLNKNNLLISLVGSATAIFVIGLIMLMNFPRNLVGQINGFFLTSLFVGGAIFSGYAFPGFRSKAKTMEYLLVPASALEKFAFEFLFRIVVYLIAYPLIFCVAINASSLIINLMYPNYNIMFYYFQDFVEIFDISQFHFIIYTSIFLALMLVFALPLLGASHFRKNPLFSTLGVLAALIATFSLYAYGISKLVFMGHRVGGVPVWADGMSRSDSTLLLMTLVIVFEVIMLAVFLSSTYYKLKEKEV